MSLGADQLVTVCLCRILRIYIHYAAIQNSQNISYRKTSADMAESSGLDALHCTDPDLQSKFLQLLNFFFCHSSLH